MIDFKAIEIGNAVKVVGAGAFDFAEMGDRLTVTAAGERFVTARRADGREASFVGEGGAARLELVTTEEEEGGNGDD